MAIATPCIYKSITLQPGESFTLPPGAILLGATDSTALTSNNGCLNLDNLETPQCYYFRFSGADEDDPGRTENWDQSNFYVDGFYVGDTYYPSSLGGGIPSTPFWTLILNALPGVFTNINSAYDYDPVFLGASRGWSATLTFDTIPSIGDNLRFSISTIAIAQGVVPSGSPTTYLVEGIKCP